jgi:hypothetical protein
MVYDFKHMYGHFQKAGLKGTEAEVTALTRVLGHAPRAFETFAAETAAVWTQESATAAR